jgi:hypothetical protein
MQTEGGGPRLSLLGALHLSTSSLKGKDALIAHLHPRRTSGFFSEMKVIVIDEINLGGKTAK